MDIEALDAAGRTLLEERPRTAKELGELLLKTTLPSSYRTVSVKSADVSG